MAITPLLQAEEDARFVKAVSPTYSSALNVLCRKYALLTLVVCTHFLSKREVQNKWEAELMKDVPGWKVGENVYKTRSFVPPTPLQPPYSHSH